MKLYKQNTDGGGKMICFKQRASLVVHIYELPTVFVAPSLGHSLHLRGVGAFCL